MKIILPKRWGRAKRKRVRRVMLIAQYWENLRKELTACLDALWGDMFRPPEGFYGLGIGHLLQQNGPFVDDAEFLP